MITRPSRPASIYQRRLPSIGRFANGLLNALRFDATVWTGWSRRRVHAVGAENGAKRANKAILTQGSNLARKIDSRSARRGFDYCAAKRGCCVIASARHLFFAERGDDI